ncbi:MAG: transcriptional repressor NrdR [Fimbriimonadaceae bacterium]|nr:transcriptional repressor NrdR [Fimbriimonadaceae bacterium]
MKCPVCGHEGQRVLETRPARDGEAVRRRRECEACRRRYTTFEAPEKPRLLVLKRNGAREGFDRDKLLQGMILACRKRPVRVRCLEEAADAIEKALYDLCLAEVESRMVGEKAMRTLFELDPVAFVRFASVYREFESVDEFEDFIRRMRPKKRDSVPEGLFSGDPHSTRL